MNNKICLIGYGYWGKILHKSLKSLSHNDVVIVDEVLDNLNQIDDSFTHYFVATTFKSHYKILNILCNFKGKKIWCEKPLVESLDDANQIYKKMELNKNKLFVDWTYTFNPCVIQIKKLLQGKKIKQVIFNRTNDGPARTDCTSIFDLSSHDLSILYYIFDFDVMEFDWNEFSIKSNEKFGSNLSWYYNDGLQIIINSSWQHKSKNRVSTFLTEDDELIVFDDVKKIVTSNKGTENFENHPSPLQVAMNHFFGEDSFEQNKKITLKITENLCNLTI